MRECKCGCGALVAKNYKKGHGRRGKKNSQEHNLTISKANKGRSLSFGQIATLQRANQDRVWTEERKLKHSQMARSKGFGLWMKGRSQSRASIEKGSLKRVGHIVTQETRNKISAANSGVKNGMYGRSHSPEALAKIADSYNRQATKWTKPELAIKEILSELHCFSEKNCWGIGFVDHAWFNARDFIFNVDFADFNNRLMIHVDGVYWHGRPGMQERDARVDLWCLENEWAFIRLSDVDIKRIPNACRQKIECFICR